MGASSKTDALSAELPARWGTFQRWKNSVIYYTIRAVVTVLRAAPRALLRAFGTVLGRLANRVAITDRNRARHQLSSAMPELSKVEVRRTVRNMFVHLAHSAVDALILDRLLRSDAGPTLPVHVRQMFEDALAEGNGVIAVSGHVGNWELCAQSIAAAGLPLSVIASPLYDPRLTRMVDAFRARNGAQVLWRGDRRVSKEMLRVFKRNEVLAMLIDQDTKVQGAFVPFFGRPAYTPVAAATLALRFKAAVIVGFTRHDGSGYRFDFERVHYPENDTAESLTAELTRRIEGVIRESPAQWVWFHRRWRRTPENDGSNR